MDDIQTRASKTVQENIPNGQYESKGNELNVPMHTEGEWQLISTHS
jgi:hypothetical protein